MDIFLILVFVLLVVFLFIKGNSVIKDKNYDLEELSDLPGKKPRLSKLLDLPKHTGVSVPFSVQSDIKKASEVFDFSRIEHRVRTHLCTDNEKKLFYSFKKALPSNLEIHCQVARIALVEPKEFKEKKRAWSKRVDYVITDQSSKVLVAIELDDSSHNTKKRRERDAYVNAALSDRHPFVRFPSQSFYEPEAIAKRLAEVSSIPNRFVSESNQISSV